MMAASMKVFKIKCIISHLINSCSTIDIVTGFEFDNKDDALKHNYRINSLTHARDYKLECEPAV